MRKITAFILVIALVFSSVGVFAEGEVEVVDNDAVKTIETALTGFKTNIDSLVTALVNRFQDMKEHWSTEWVAKLTQANIISGYSDGTFRPDDSITRAEFTKLLVTSLHEDPGVYKEGYWAKNYIDKAIAEGYLEKGEFKNIDKEITRGEMARMISKALNEDPENIDKLKGQITDFDNIPGEFKNQVARVYAAGIISGYPDGSFKSGRTSTRAEASTMLVRLLDKEEREVPEVKEIKDEIVIDGEKIENIEVKEIIEPYYNISEYIKKQEGYNKIFYPWSKDVICMLYREDAEPSLYVSDMYIEIELEKRKDELPQYKINIRNFNGKTSEMLKVFLKEFYPKSYEKAFKMAKKAYEDKGDAFPILNLDGRRFTPTYGETDKSINVFIGTKE